MNFLMIMIIRRMIRMVTVREIMRRWTNIELEIKKEKI